MLFDLDAIYYIEWRSTRIYELINLCEIQIFISCNVLYMMMQYAYLRTNKFKRELQILFSSNVFYMTTQYAYLWYIKF